MKNDFLTIVKKEFKRFFGDKRLFISTVFLPGIMIFAIYSILGQVMGDMFAPDEDHPAMVYSVDAPESAKSIFDVAKIDYKDVSIKDAEKIKKEIRDGESQVMVTFSKNFDKEVEAYNPISSKKEAPLIEIYYNSSNTDSQAMYGNLEACFNNYESAMTNKFDINRDETVNYDLATKEDSGAQIFSMIVPMLLIMMLMSGCMAVAPDAIAGEKERGTIATILVTPIKRSSLALGKVVSLGVFALLSGISSTLGVLLSLPKLMGGAGDGISANIYSTSDYAVLCVTVFSTTLAIICIFSLLSTFAKTVKEASSYCSPVMILGMVVGIAASAAPGNSETKLQFFTIPIYNSAKIFNGIFSMNYSMTQVGVTIIANLVFVGICVYAMTKMFDNEKIMFSR